MPKSLGIVVDMSGEIEANGKPDIIRSEKNIPMLVVRNEEGHEEVVVLLEKPLLKSVVHVAVDLSIFLLLHNLTAFIGLHIQSAD